PPGRRARGIPRRAAPARRRARDRAEPGAAGARARDPPPGPGARRAERRRFAAPRPDRLRHARCNQRCLPCGVGRAVRAAVRARPQAPVLVPFGGGREGWAALELGAWLARAHALPLRLLGVESGAGRRDASRTLAGASLALQRFAGASAEPVLVPPGPEGI